MPRGVVGIDPAKYDTFDPDSIAARIIHLRKENGWSAYRLANELGIDSAAIRKWESGDVMPTLKYLCALAQAFDVTTDYLAGATKPHA